MWKHCPLCGGKLEKPQENFHGLCSKCTQHWHKSPRPTVVGIIYKLNNPLKVLFTRRGIQPKKDLLDLPGGFVDPDELPKEAMLREAKEELAVELENLKFLHHINSKYTYQQITFISLNNLYTATIKKGQTPKPKDDVSKLTWLNIQTKIPQLAFPPLEKSLKLYRQNQLKNQS